MEIIRNGEELVRMEMGLDVRIDSEDHAITHKFGSPVDSASQW